MSFTRTPTGLSNQHLFYKVDYVVYTEGGTQTFSMQDLASGSFDEEAPDLHYWQAVFAFACPQLKVRFLPAGSKSTLLQLAQKIANGNIAHVMVAMDQDHDRFFGKLIQANGVFYTWGYSWENDVCCPETLEEVFFNLSPRDRRAHEKTIRASIHSCYQRFINDVRHLIRADIVLRIGNKSLFPRNNYQNLIKKPKSAQFPILDRSKLRRRLTGLRQQCTTSLRLSSPERPLSERDCFGHLLSRFFYRLLMHLLESNSSMPCPPQETFYALMVNAFDRHLASGNIGKIRTHHHAQFAAFSA